MAKVHLGSSKSKPTRDYSGTAPFFSMSSDLLDAEVVLHAGDVLYLPQGALDQSTPSGQKAKMTFNSFSLPSLRRKDRGGNRHANLMQLLILSVAALIRRSARPGRDSTPRSRTRGHLTLAPCGAQSGNLKGLRG